jgi:LysR family transcriptional regulator, glycine cleavage system transcriptional activator
MPILHPQLPSFSALVAFESVARLGTFVAAAHELRVTQAAISQKITELESWLGVTLIFRRRPTIAITDEGMRIAEAVRAGVSIMSLPLEVLRADRGSPNRVTLAATNAFSSFWLTPRLHSFYAAYPNIELNLLTSDRELTTDRRSFDLGIAFVNQPWTDYTEDVLFDDEVVPVASSSYIKSRRQKQSDDFSNDSLLYLNYVEASWHWHDWSDWFKWRGISNYGSSHKHQFSNYVLLIQAAIDGHGIALGSRRLIDPLLDQGQLIQLDKGMPAFDGKFKILIHNRFVEFLSPSARSLRKWLLAQAASAPIYYSADDTKQDTADSATV